MATIQFANQQYELGGGSTIVVHRVENDEGSQVKADFEGVVRENRRTVNGINGMDSKQDVSEASFGSPYKLYEDREGNVNISNKSQSSIKVRYPTKGEEIIRSSGGHAVENVNGNKVTVMIGGFGFDIIV